MGSGCKLSDATRDKGQPRVRALLCAFVAVVVQFGSMAAHALTFTVNSNSDVHDATPGNGVCETATGNHICTLRAAIEEANALAGADTIALQANTTYLLTLTSTIGFITSDIVIDDSVAIAGAGAAGTIIDGNGGATGQRVFALLKCIGNAMPDMAGNCPTGNGNGNVVVNISGVTIEHGFSANFAGGIYNVATLTLDHCIVTGNTANGLNDWGGAIYNAGPLTVKNSVISNNTTGAHNAYGGAVYNQSDMTITDSTISGNSTHGGPSSPGFGGGIFNVSSTKTTIKNSTISGNSAVLGGGIYKAGGPSLIVINSTISGNFSDGSGGGIYAASGTTGLYNVTVTQNQANADDAGTATGGGVANAAGSTLNVANSIIADNELVIPTMPFPTLDLDDCTGTIMSLGNDIVTNVNTGHCTIAGPYATDNPLLGPLQFNGGVTQTHALSDGSPAIDKGNSAGCTDDLGAPIMTDQRGVPRPYGPYCDIGAFEAADIIFRNGFQ